MKDSLTFVMMQELIGNNICRIEMRE